MVSSVALTARWFLVIARGRITALGFYRADDARGKQKSNCGSTASEERRLRIPGWPLKQPEAAQQGRWALSRIAFAEGKSNRGCPEWWLSVARPARSQVRTGAFIN